MKKYVVSLCVAMGLLWMIDIQSVQAQRHRRGPDPVDLADRCIDQAQAVAERSVRRIDARKVAAVDSIAALLEEGETEQAEQVAERAIRRVRGINSVGVRIISRNCQWCVNILNHLGMPDLADEVIAVCDEAIDQIEAAASEAIEEIQAALDGDSDDDDDWIPPE